MQLVLKIKSPEVIEETRRGGKNGTWQSRTQKAVFESEEEKRVVQIQLETGQQPYPVGEYVLSHESFAIDSNGRLDLAFRLKLEPYKGAAVRAA